MRVFNRLVNEFGLNEKEFIEVPLSRVSDIAFLSSSSEDARHLLDEAKVFTSLQWKDRKRELLKRPLPDDGHLHKMKNYQICEVCGFRMKNEKG
jgi:hypothetical protein